VRGHVIGVNRRHFNDVTAGFLDVRSQSLVSQQHKRISRLLHIILSYLHHSRHGSKSQISSETDRLFHLLYWLFSVTEEFV